MVLMGLVLFFAMAYYMPDIIIDAWKDRQEHRARVRQGMTTDLRLMNAAHDDRTDLRLVNTSRRKV